MIGATLLTAFNDNAAVTFLASTVPQPCRRPSNIPWWPAL